MLVPIHIDAQDLADQFSINQRDVDALKRTVVQKLALAYSRQWDEEAKSQLNSSRNIYRRNLIVGEDSEFVSYVMLTGAFPNMIEKGASAFDMKLNFAKSSKIRYDKKGAWYLIIPFRFATPNALGENSVFSNVLPKSVYDKIIQTVTPTTSQIGERVNWGGGLSTNNIPQQYRAPKSREAFSDLETKRTFDKYTHQSSIYKGITRSQKTYENATQSSYVSFRRVGQNSDPNSWIHKGFIAKNLAQSALNNLPVEAVVGSTVDDFIVKLT